ncbi:hypothetical protein [Paramagnetospirillum marisnigri]|uniref:hypothetical protein n=1 Tax=Paramagnetospirillum marisnigri TaxID=1285242 RepID=UPI000B16DBA0|nr:hypothetical protein [Paramagnetospirillum marisnigri]
MDDTLDITARRMMIRFGDAAGRIVADRARELARRGDWRAQDTQLLVLNRIEAMGVPAP